MPEVRIRKKLTTVEEILHEGGPVASAPLRRAAVLAVIHNPFAGHYVENIAGFMVDVKPLGFEMARGLIAVLGGDPRVMMVYGKGVIFGFSSELERGWVLSVACCYGVCEIR